MKDRVRTLVLDANGIPSGKVLLADTVLRGLLGLKAVAAGAPSAQGKHSFVAKLFGQRYESLSYIADWREALAEAPELDVRVCTITNLIEFAACRKAIKQYPLVIILHSAAGDSMSLLRKTTGWFKRRRGKLVVFLGNEYDLLDEKIQFIRSVEADFVCSQLPIETARWLYRDCEPSKILAMPHALNPRIYSPGSSAARPIDIGFVGDIYHNIIGDRERTNLIEFFQYQGDSFGLECEMRFQRSTRADWAQFLRSCKGTVGAEAGTYYLDRHGEGIAKAKAYAKKYPEAALSEVVANCFPGLDYISGKAISSRHFEAIGTKTCQLLIEGRYNGILKADEDYISVKRDLSNIADAIARFKDDAYRSGIVEHAYETILSAHTYRHRVSTLIQTVMS